MENADIDNENSRTQKKDDVVCDVNDIMEWRDANDTTKSSDNTKCHDVIPPSCKRQLCSTGAASEGDAAADQDSLELAKTEV